MNKTQPTNVNIDDFLETIPEQVRRDSRELIALMSEVTGEKPVLWGSSIIGFGNYHYKYESGREGDWMRIGFSPRKAAISLYLNCELDEIQNELASLGSYTTGKSCVYIKRLCDVDLEVLRLILKKSYERTAA